MPAVAVEDHHFVAVAEFVGVGGQIGTGLLVHSSSCSVGYSMT
jgi:hypothetical protein